MISNKEYTALIIVSASWVYFVGANLVFALSTGRIQDSPLLLPDGGDTRINVWPKQLSMHKHLAETLIKVKQIITLLPDTELHWLALSLSNATPW